jgi:hypothetical protein
LGCSVSTLPNAARSRCFGAILVSFREFSLLLKFFLFWKFY